MPRRSDQQASGLPEPADFEADLEPGLKATEKRALLKLAAELATDRPVPPPGLRSEVRSRLVSPRAGAPRALGAMIFGYASTGLLLLAVAALGVAGTGPFAA